MNFNNEEEFRKWIVKEVSAGMDQDWMVLHGKNVSDVVLCKNDERYPLMFFVEVKYHKSTHGRIGFGSGTGKGYQPEILIKKPKYLEKYLRWLVCDHDSERCLFFTNEDVRNNCAGRIEEGKQNNFTNRLFDKNKTRCFSLTEAPLKIIKWAKEQSPDQSPQPIADKSGFG